MAQVDDDAQAIMGALLIDGRNAANAEFRRICKDRKLNNFQSVVLADRVRKLADAAEEQMKRGEKINKGVRARRCDHRDASGRRCGDTSFTSHFTPDGTVRPGHDRD